MNAVEAMEWAADYAERNQLFAVPMNGRGYPVDGMKPPTHPEKVQMLRDLAASVTDEPLSPDSARQVRRLLVDCVHDLKGGRSADPFRYDPHTVSDVEMRLEKIVELLP